MTAMFVNLPVTDIERAKAFYAAVGFTPNPAMSDHNGACFIVEQDHSYLMVLTREYFQTFTDLPIGDPAVNPSVSTAIFLDSREAVDATLAAGIAAGTGRSASSRVKYAESSPVVLTISRRRPGRADLGSIFSMISSGSLTSVPPQPRPGCATWK